MVDLSIIIVNFNTKDLLGDCLNLIFENTSKINYEIWVVDNNSTDGSSEMLKTKFPNINLIENGENLGFSKANNQAIRICNGRYVLLLNPDTIVMHNSLDLMVEFMDSNPAIGIIGPETIYPDGTVQPSAGVLYNLYNVFMRQFNLKAFVPPSWQQFGVNHLGRLLGGTITSGITPYINNKKFPREVDFVSGCSMLIRREVIKEIGMLDEKFFLYMEDIDYCKRIKQTKWKVLFFPYATIVHIGGQSSNGMFRSYNPETYKSVLYYFYKHHSKGKLLLVKGIIILALICKVGCLWIANLSSRGKNKKIKNALESYKRIFKSIWAGK